MSSSWTTDDEQFFHVIDGLFPPTFLDGAGVLLASYDSETTPSATPSAAPSTPSVASTSYASAPAVSTETR